jgi:hypothetical protein
MRRLKSDTRTNEAVREEALSVPCQCGEEPFQRVKAVAVIECVNVNVSESRKECGFFCFEEVQ